MARERLWPDVQPTRKQDSRLTVELVLPSAVVMNGLFVRDEFPG